MNSASSTTITVNTSLFAAGDTVFIVNQGAGVCTITAGTATVNTASSLALSQYETGELYFLSTSAAIFSEYQQAAAASGSMTLLASGSFSSSALSLTSISGSYKNLVLIFENYYRSGGTDTNIRLNSDSGSNYAWAQYATGLTSFNQTTNSTNLQVNQPGFNSAPGSLYMTIYNYANTNSYKFVETLFNGNAGGNKNAVLNIATYQSTLAITGILTTDAMTSGSYYLYGVN